MKKLVGIVCGGYSGEAVVSMKSAAMIMTHIDRERYDAVKIVIDKKGWYADLDGEQVPIDRNDFSYTENGKHCRPNLCFITVHGTPGEDGKLQGYFDLIDMPYTTGSVLNTALTFNKLVTSILLRQMGFRTAAGMVVHHPDHLDVELVKNELRFPVFVKPNEGGSSLGVSKVDRPEDLPKAVAKAYDEKSSVLIEEYLTGPEYTCGVICQPGKYEALAVTEIETDKAFFDYAGKYDYEGIREITPARLPADLYEKCREVSARIAEALDCRGIVRSDYKLIDGEFFVIEVNTTPGMTERSLVPQQAEEVGIDKKELVTRIIETAGVK